jgi:hypothetical protein
MNIGELSVRKDRVVFVLMFLVLAGGLVAYHKLGRLEDPEFTIKEALIITPYPGASAEEVAREVTNPIESACPHLGQLKHQSNRERLPATGSTQASRVGVHTWTIGRLGHHTRSVPEGRDPPGLGRASAESRRRTIQTPALGSR